MKKLCTLCLIVVGLTVTAQAVVFDESTSGLTYSGDGSGYYEPGATPDDGVADNEITFKAGSATATINLQAGQRYKIVSRRKVNDNWQFAYHLSLDGQLAYYDASLAKGEPAESYQSCTYQGYYTAVSGATVVSVHDGGGYFTRLDYLSFEITSDVFFDEMSNLTYTGLAGLTGLKGCVGHGSSDNGFGFGSTDTVAGNVDLVQGTTYNVYVSRATNSVSDVFGYDLKLDGDFFAHDEALTSGYFDDSGWAEEILLGQFTAGSNSIAVEFLNGGASAARIDGLRFEVVPEPATLALLAMGFIMVHRKRS